MENVIQEEKRWYVIRCYSGNEKKAKKHIDSEFNKQNLYGTHVIRTVIPTRKEVYVKKGKKITREVNYYPGYVLIETDMSPEVQHIIKNTLGVMNILGSKEKPEPLKIDEVKRLLGKIDDLTEIGDKNINDFVVGENVVIKDGPFNNFNAVIEEINDEKKKLRVSIKIFGRKTPLDIDYEQVLKI